MRITINGEAADIKLEQERTLGDLLSGVELWLEKNGFSLSAVNIDGAMTDSADLTTIASRELSEIGCIDFGASSWSELMDQALDQTSAFLRDFQAMPFAERDQAAKIWTVSAAAGLLKERDRLLYAEVVGHLVGRGLSAAELDTHLDERLRELREPAAVLRSMEPDLSAIGGRMEDVPLDFQTGKDGRASETLRLFTYALEKLLRIVPHLAVEDDPLLTLLADLSIALKELLAAYEAKDLVLVGDLAEYELAPRLRTLHAALSRVLIGQVQE
jgi:hypothetical protein